MSAVLLERDYDGIVWFTINRQEKRNAINYEVMDALQETIRLVEENDKVKVLVITGAGDQAFCSGGDLSEFHHLHAKEEAYHMLAKMGSILYSLLTLSKPTVALLNGTAVGGGCELATACDFRYAKKGVKAGFIQGTLGITTGWGGATMLFEKIPYANALDLLLRAERVPIEKMYEYGWVHKLLSGETIKEQCRKLLSPYLSQSVPVLRAYKQIAVKKWKTDEFRAKFFAEIEQCAVLWESEEHEEAVRTFLNRS
ncbi:enoyl-CoA hydratase/carnithine racemase [Anoxybacillus tepidamans]|uniref:Ethylmalonyl-CoA decarboxylase n=1 Tax=Anoxybacteroides tepidamans TaxID=265948 RepID=A0A7W8MVL5_9BACL|nr:enoyl-CoA hydratase/isomerase family protein [Anoxybacillus tepidamans]MBB5323790.1 enoyl-CoA hydratase/carnithine racemase [Anoxybacillus tepidamans]